MSIKQIWQWDMIWTVQLGHSCHSNYNYTWQKRCHSICIYGDYIVEYWHQKTLLLKFELCLAHLWVWTQHIVAEQQLIVYDRIFTQHSKAQIGEKCLYEMHIFLATIKPQIPARWQNVLIYCLAHEMLWIQRRICVYIQMDNLTSTTLLLLLLSCEVSVCIQRQMYSLKLSIK